MKCLGDAVFCSCVLDSFRPASGLVEVWRVARVVSLATARCVVPILVITATTQSHDSHAKTPKYSQAKRKSCWSGPVQLEIPDTAWLVRKNQNDIGPSNEQTGWLAFTRR